MSVDIGVYLLSLSRRSWNLRHFLWENLNMGSITDWISAICAAVAVVAAFITVWWPWHTRRSPNIECRVEPFVLDSGTLGDLLIATRLRKPELAVNVRNTGDGTAHALRTYGGEKNECVFFRPKEEGKFVFSSELISLKPDEHILVIILPLTEQSVPNPAVHLEWKEEPTRLKRSLVRKLVPVHKTLEAKHPLGHQERILALGSLTKQARAFGRSVTDQARMYGLHLEDLDPYDPDRGQIQ